MIFVATTDDGGEIRYVDRKRWLWIISVLTPSVPAIGALALWATGNPVWALLPVLVYYVATPLIDMVVGSDPNNPPEAVVGALSEDQYYRALLFLSVPVFWASFLVPAIVASTQPVPVWAWLLLAVGAGASSGTGLTVAHELGHKPNRLDQWGAKIMCALSGYAHFCLEHNRGHHVQVATPEDRASGRLGESLYAFAAREIPSVVAEGWALERKRLEKKGLPFWHWRNDLLQGYAIALAVAALLVAFLGWIVLPFIAISHAVAWFHLSMANYVEHYGLKRDRKPNGRYGPCEPRHSWNTNHIVSNLMLFHLQRHSDHHANPLRPYQALRNFDDLPHLPSGYPGSFVLAAIPPLWRKMMDPKVCKWAKGDVDRCNVRPGLENAYALKFQNWPA